MDTQTPESTPRARRVRIPINKEGLTVGGMRFSVRRLIGFGLVLLMFILMLCPWYTFNAGENGGAFLNSLGLNGLGRLGDGESLEITSRFGPFSGINKLCLDMKMNMGLYDSSMKGVKMSGGFDISMGVQSQPLSEVSGWMVAAKVLLIIDLVVLALYIATLFVDATRFIPSLAALGKNALNRYLHIAFYALIALALMLGFIGDLSCDMSEYVHLAFAWYLSAIVCACGLVNIFKPAILKNLLARRGII
ncbi:MAG: hypothetical protein IKR85_01625 [Clostridia bacterium]|nr:hypothetical protein [Clostridia bacterium]